jgi:hypothetical protein
MSHDGLVVLRRPWGATYRNADHWSFSNPDRFGHVCCTAMARAGRRSCTCLLPAGMPGGLIAR